jgi:hypothetical protein
MHTQHRQIWLFQGHGVVRILFSGHPSRILFFISSFTEHYTLRYFVRCSSVRWYVYMNLFMIFTHPQYHQILVFRLMGWSVFHFPAISPEFFLISPSTKNYGLWYFVRRSCLTWYVFMNLFMIFMHPQHREIRIIQGHGVVGISFTGHPVEFFYFFLYRAI